MVNCRVVNRSVIIAGVSGGVQGAAGRAGPAAGHRSLVRRRPGQPALRRPRRRSLPATTGGGTDEPDRCKPGRASGRHGGCCAWLAAAYIGRAGGCSVPSGTTPSWPRSASEAIRAGEVSRLLAKATGGKPAAAAARAVSPGPGAGGDRRPPAGAGLCPATRRSGHAGRNRRRLGRIEGDAHVAAPHAGRFPQGPVDRPRRSSPPACLERGLGAVPGPLRHAGAAARPISRPIAASWTAAGFR